MYNKKNNNQLTNPNNKEKEKNKVKLIKKIINIKK